jgi:hypothetical protein
MRGDFFEERREMAGGAQCLAAGGAGELLEDLWTGLRPKELLGIGNDLHGDCSSGYFGILVLRHDLDFHGTLQVAFARRRPGGGK